MALFFYQVKPPHLHCLGGSAVLSLGRGVDAPWPLSRSDGSWGPELAAAKTRSCYPASLLHVNENQLNWPGIRYIIHFINNSVLSLAGKCLLAKNIARASGSSLSEQILRCWMKPRSRWWAEWSCLWTGEVKEEGCRDVLVSASQERNPEPQTLCQQAGCECLLVSALLSCVFGVWVTETQTSSLGSRRGGTSADLPDWRCSCPSTAPCAGGVQWWGNAEWRGRRWVKKQSSSMFAVPNSKHLIW